MNMLAHVQLLAVNNCVALADFVLVQYIPCHCRGISRHAVSVRLVRRFCRNE